MVEIKKALELKQELDTLRPINTEQEQRIMQKFRLDWNYHSNHLEGNSLTYGETKALLLFGVTAQGKPLKDTLEITGHNEALNWVIDVVKKNYPLTENFIRELHSLLLKDSYKGSLNEEGKIVSRRISAGKYKSNPNHVLTATGEMFYFATPEETPAKMYDLLNWYKEKTEEKDVNPIFIAAEFHYKFIRIHPFDDGNGRTARILMNFILMQFGFPPVIIKTQDKENYFAVLRLADAGNLEAFVTYIAENLNVSLEIMIAGAKGENIEEEDDLDKEIALLEQRLSGFGERAKRLKNNKDLKDLLTIDIKEIIDNLKTKTIKLSKMYIENSIEVNVFFLGLGNKKGLRPYNLDIILNNTSFDNIPNDMMSEITIDIEYKNFNRIELNAFNYRSLIYIKLLDIKYEIILRTENQLELKLFEKPYGERFTVSEIDKIVKSEMKRHKEFIEQKIAEKENK